METCEFRSDRVVIFEFNGKKYKTASTHQKEWGTGLIAEIPLTGNERILDLGCGDGVLTQRLAELVPKGSVLGIDASAGMIDAAKELEQGNLAFRRLDINEMVFENEFDLVFSNAALHWILDHERLLGKVYRALKPGGMARFNFAGDGNCVHFFAVVREVMGEPLFREHYKLFSWPWYMPAVDEYKALVNRYDFREALIWEENADRYFSDREGMIRWIDQPSIVPFLQYLPDDKKAAFRFAVVKGMIEQTLQADGTCFETFRRINLLAWK
ncbi:methyltransferase domain-containing protein [Heliobacterium gestii]|uniref:Methyltransferase domain-containing protein n=1 Tax=Heliomicrobium gestii TaxID=2699 RepID=A0A845LLX0_HELGE|nr:methyltransferase domain-containing protein [Heliomicrobium gestii]